MDRSTPFLLEPEFAPSAPPMLVPTLIAEGELEALALKLRTQRPNGFEEQRRTLHTELFGKVIHYTKIEVLLREFDAAYRLQAARELFELQAIIESGSGDGFMTALLAEGGALGLSSPEAKALQAQVLGTVQQATGFLPDGVKVPAGFDIGAALPSAPPATYSAEPSAPPPEPSAPPPEPRHEPNTPPPNSPNLQGTLVLHFNGSVVTVLSDPMTTTLAGLLNAASQHLGVPSFDPALHEAVMVWPGRRPLTTGLHSKLASLFIPSCARVLWRERSPKFDSSAPADPKMAGKRFQQLRSTFFSEKGSSGQMYITKGELRNFLWNLNLDDDAFGRVWKRMDTRSHGFLDINDLLHLVGRAHMKHPSVPIDVLLNEAVVLIARPSTETFDAAQSARPGLTHFDNSPAETPEGIGCVGALELHGGSYCASFLLVFGVIFLLVLCLQGGDLDDPDDRKVYGWMALFAYIIYLAQSFHWSRFMSSLGNRMSGLDNVCNAMERPKQENPYYRWRVQNYHYETRTREETYKDSEGNSKTRTVTETIRVNTSFYNASGVIPSHDYSPEFVPNTRALLTEIDTELSCDFSQSNYWACYQDWCYTHRYDVHQDASEDHDLPSRKKAILAEWVPGHRPCWMNRTCYVLSSVFLCALPFRLRSQSQCGSQDFTYRKRCYRIDYTPPSGRSSGGILAGIEIAAAVLTGASVW
eukprot:TRINITY_DN933_c2_g1_i1.p1 TRINITY_DN933_c2_g1~~TRINITY_DN933_c2_g1_i1.p1  ORF type:complete len:699 (+),score=89.96 TRINITY_DN933_c2_g1_i1:86-2182(+)